MRKTNFLWRHRNGKLTVKAKTHLSKALKKYYFEKKLKEIIEIPKEKVAQYYKYQIEVKFKGKNKSTGKVYDFMKVRVWINDIKEHTEQELKRALHDVLKDVFNDKRIGSGIAKGSIMYDVAGLEIEEIAKSEANHIGQFQYYCNIKEKWIKENVI